MHVPNKIKHFVWRVCNNALPTKCNLKRRHIANSDVCELCNDAPKDALHALCFCNHVAPVWLPYQWFQSMISLRPLNFCDLLNKFMQVGDELKTEMFATITWSLWNRRNAFHFGRDALPVAKSAPLHMLCSTTSLPVRFQKLLSLDLLFGISVALQNKDVLK